jgi:hypothetical protein
MHARTNWQVDFHLFLTESYIFQADHHSPCVQETEGNLPKCLPPITLMVVAMNCIERQVMAHINTIILETLDPLQFAYHVPTDPQIN